MLPIFDILDSMGQSEMQNIDQGVKVGHFNFHGVN